MWSLSKVSSILQSWVKLYDFLFLFTMETAVVTWAYPQLIKLQRFIYLILWQVLSKHKFLYSSYFES